MLSYPPSQTWTHNPYHIDWTTRKIYLPDCLKGYIVGISTSWSGGSIRNLLESFFWYIRLVAHCIYSLACKGIRFIPRQTKVQLRFCDIYRRWPINGSAGGPGGRGNLNLDADASRLSPRTMQMIVINHKMLLILRPECWESLGSEGLVRTTKPCNMNHVNIVINSGTKTRIIRKKLMYVSVWFIWPNHMSIIWYQYAAQIDARRFIPFSFA